MPTKMQVLEWTRDDLVVTELDIHIAAYVALNQGHLPFLVSPSAFIRWRRALKARAYWTARNVFLALGCEVPDVPVPGSGQLQHMFPALQLAWRRMKEEGEEVNSV